MSDTIEKIRKATENWQRIANANWRPTCHFPYTSVLHEEGILLAERAAGKKAIEIGTGTGLSSAYIASSADSLVTIDIDPVARDAAVSLFDVCGIHNATAILRENDSVQKCRLFDFAFIDSSHTTEGLRQDFDEVCANIEGGGIIALHDVQRNMGSMYPEVVFVDNLISSGDWDVEETGTECGLTFLRRKGATC